MPTEQEETPLLHSLVWAAGVDVLPLDRVFEQKDGYVLIRSPGNPTHHWGNLLLFDRPPLAGDAQRWERLFALEFGDEPRVQHKTFAWDRTAGLAREEFIGRGYDLEESIGLVAERDEVRAHPRENRSVVVRALDPAPDADEELWNAVVELQVANRDQRYVEQAHRAFARARLDGYRALFRAGRGAWYVAADPANGAIVASCGVVVADARGRFQAVDTALSHRRLGICSRLVVEASQRSAAVHGTERFVIVADAGYQALGLYESLGFTRQEHVFGVCRPPRAEDTAERA